MTATCNRMRQPAADIRQIRFCTDCRKKSSAGSLIHLQQTVWFLHKQNWAASTDMDFIVTLSGLDKTSSVAYYLGQTQTCNCYSFNRAVKSIDYVEILKSVWQEEENFEALKRCYIQIYPTSVLLCYGKAVILFNICETYSGLMWSSCERNSGTQLNQSVSDIMRE